MRAVFQNGSAGDQFHPFREGLPKAHVPEIERAQISEFGSHGKDLAQSYVPFRQTVVCLYFLAVSDLAAFLGCPHLERDPAESAGRNSSVEPVQTHVKTVIGLDKGRAQFQSVAGAAAVIDRGGVDEVQEERLFAVDLDAAPDLCRGGVDRRQNRQDLAHSAWADVFRQMNSDTRASRSALLRVRGVVVDQQLEFIGLPGTQFDRGIGRKRIASRHFYAQKMLFISVRRVVFDGIERNAVDNRTVGIILPVGAGRRGAELAEAFLDRVQFLQPLQTFVVGRGRDRDVLNAVDLPLKIVLELRSVQIQRNDGFFLLQRQFQLQTAVVRSHEIAGDEQKDDGRILQFAFDRVIP